MAPGNDRAGGRRVKRGRSSRARSGVGSAVALAARAALRPPGGCVGRWPSAAAWIGLPRRWAVGCGASLRHPSRRRPAVPGLGPAVGSAARRPVAGSAASLGLAAGASPASRRGRPWSACRAPSAAGRRPVGRSADGVVDGSGVRGLPPASTGGAAARRLGLGSASRRSASVGRRRLGRRRRHAVRAGRPPRTAGPSRPPRRSASRSRPASGSARRGRTAGGRPARAPGPRCPTTMTSGPRRSAWRAGQGASASAPTIGARARGDRPGRRLDRRRARAAGARPPLPTP